MAEIAKVEGLRELAQALRSLPVRVASKQLAKPVAQAGAMIRDAARIMAPYYTGAVSKGHPPPGTLKKAIILKKKPSGSPFIADYIVTVKHGKRYQDVGKQHQNLDAFYWTFVEFGSIHNPKTPFLRPAFEALKNDALRVIVDGLRLGVETEAQGVTWFGGSR